MKLSAGTTGSIPFIFLVIDGAVENEREICNKVKDHCSSGLPICSRLCTFGIGAYCNNYFLQMLSHIGRGYHDAAYDAVVSANVSGVGNFLMWKKHSYLKMEKLRPSSSRTIYFIGLEVAKMSIQSQVPSEYTCMILLETVREKITSDVTLEVHEKVNFEKMLDFKGQRVILLGSLGKGFGNLAATVKNIPPGVEEKMSGAADVLVKAASNCCGKLMDRICCMCFIQTCSYVNDWYAVALTQLCIGPACFGCIDCCFDLCE